jgi:hypothetical protein
VVGLQIGLAHRVGVVETDHVARHRQFRGEARPRVTGLTPRA